jgi:hypothetical protein
MSTMYGSSTTNIEKRRVIAAPCSGSSMSLGLAPILRCQLTIVNTDSSGLNWVESSPFVLLVLPSRLVKALLVYYYVATWMSIAVVCKTSTIRGVTAF